jgi:uncharacterized Zn-finger protein
VTKADDPADHEYTDEPVCPYCGELYEDAWEIDCGMSDDQEVEVDCPGCEKPFLVTRDITVRYTTKKKEVPDADHP